MFTGLFKIPKPDNEKILSYQPGTKERTEITATLKEMLDNPVEVPIIIGGKEYKSNEVKNIIAPHDHQKILGKYYIGNSELAEKAIDAANKAKKEWRRMTWISRATIIRKAAELLSGKYRMVLNAATMLCMSKTCHQAEIDSACELIDFWRFNPFFMRKIYEDQPISTGTVLNYMERRPLEGFVFAITPFNFTSIAGNLPTAPALMGNAVVWKPSSTAILPAYYIMKILEEAGMPEGVVNMIPGPGSVIAPTVLNHRDLGGVHFTGSTYVFSTIWLAIGSDIRKYYSYPRIVGETGGKDFIFAHESSNIDVLATAIVRGAFEYQGQKCSAASRMYIPDTIWPALRKRLEGMVRELKMGDITDFTNFMGAVIDKDSFRKISDYIQVAKNDSNYEIIAGGGFNDEKGYFIEPTVITSKDPRSKLMTEEIFGPVATIYVYPSQEYEETLELCDQTSPYALTGAIFAQDRQAIVRALYVLRDAAGNFYINDKPTGAVVAQQPFGGSRASGTNDKAGSWLNLERWVSPRAVKENLLPPEDYKYPYMEEDA